MSNWASPHLETTHVSLWWSILALSLLLAPNHTLAQSEAWVREYRTENVIPSHNGATAVAVDVDGNVYVTGTAGEECLPSGCNGGNITTIKYDPDGNAIWKAIYESPGSDWPRDLLVDDLGNVYVTGSVDYGRGFVTLKYSAGGREQWAARSEHEIGPELDDLVVDASGNVYVTVRVTAGRSYDAKTFKYTPDGSEQWVIHVGEGLGIVSSRVDASGNTYVLGGGNTGHVGITAMYDSVGVQLWTYNQTGWTPQTLTLDTNGNVYINGHSTLCDGALTVKLRSSGIEEWSMCHAALEFYWESLVWVDQRGNVYVALDQVSGFVTLKFNSGGNLQWIAERGNSSSAYVRGLAVDNSGNVVMAGDTFTESNGWKFTTVMYDSTGNEKWVARFDTTAESWERGAGLAVAGNGAVVVTGGSERSLEGWPGRSDYATVKYDSAGVQQWAVWYGHDHPAKSTCLASGMAIDSRGETIVSGIEASGIVTVKYTTTGDERWVRKIPVQKALWRAWVDEVVVDRRNNVYLAGGIDTDFFIVKYSPGGQESWQARLTPGTADRHLSRIAVNDNGAVVLAARIYAIDYPAPDWHPCVTALYDSLGAKQWLDTLPYKTCTPGGVTFDDADRIWIALSSSTEGRSDQFELHSIQYDLSGEIGRETSFGLYNDMPGIPSLTSHPSGGIVIRAVTNGEDTIIKLDEEGREESRFGVPLLSLPYGWWVAKTQVAVDSSGTIYVSGSAATAAYRLPGIELWTAYHDFFLHHNEIRTAADRDGNLFVAGTVQQEHPDSEDSSEGDYFIVSYRSDGREMWTSRYDGPHRSSDRLAGMTIDQEGNVFVTGTSHARESGSVITTVKYGSTPTAEEGDEISMPDRLSLGVFPNPFRERATIAFTLSEAESVRLVVHDIGGREIGDLLDQMMPAGRHEITLAGRDLPAGPYLVRLLSPSGSTAASMIHLP